MLHAAAYLPPPQVPGSGAELGSVHELSIRQIVYGEAVLLALAAGAPPATLAAILGCAGNKPPAPPSLAPQLRRHDE